MKNLSEDLRLKLDALPNESGVYLMKRLLRYHGVLAFEPLLGPPGAVNLEEIHWVIAGGESGPGARPVQAEWLRNLRDQCQAQDVAFFFKQWGGRTPKAGGNTLDGRQWQEYPEVKTSQGLRAPLQATGAPVDGTISLLSSMGPSHQEKNI